MKFAVIQNSKVINVIEAESLEIAEAVSFNGNVVESTESNIAHIGLGYDGTTFEQPPTEEA
jgi:hypothetical protein